MNSSLNPPNPNSPDPVKKLLLVLLPVAALLGWFAREWSAPSPAESRPAERKVLYYQSPMHPWVKSDRPGKCTICGMDLTPVLEGDRGFEAGEEVVALSSNQVAVIHVATAGVTRQPLRRTLRVAGTIDDNEQKHRVLSAYVDGRVDRLFVNYLGAEVAAGQPLAAFYSPMLLTAAREYLALMQPARRPEDTLLPAAALRLRQLGLTDRQIAELPVTFTPTNLTLELVAPMTGTVVAKDVYEGQYVKEGDRLFELADFSTMWFQFDAYERDLAWLELGQEVEVTTPSLPGHVFTNAIAFIDPNLLEATRSARVRVEIPNPQMDEGGRSRRLLRHRLYAEGRVNVATPGVLGVPRTAVLSPGERPVVYVELGNGSYERRPVRLGRAGDELWEILEGVREGERVVTRGNLLIDAQAQLHADSHGPVHDHGETNAPSRAVALNPAQVATLTEFMTLADRLREALSADNLAAFNELAPSLHAAAPGLAEALRENPGWHPYAEAILRVSHLDAAPDLAAARNEFHALSLETVKLVKRLRSADTNFAGLKVFQCPMTRQAFPGAPPRAEWLQLGGPVRNPYFGAAMLDCGTEVKP